MSRNLRRAPLLLPLVLCLASALISSADETTKTELSWQGATAEDLEGVIRAIAPSMTLAVIRDERAVIYHQASVRKTIAELEETENLRSVGLVLSRPAPVKDGLPEDPKQAKKPILRITINAEKTRLFGIKTADLAAQLRKLGCLVDRKAALQALEGEMVDTPGGARVPLRELVTASEAVVRRPLIIRSEKARPGPE